MLAFLCDGQILAAPSAICATKPALTALPSKGASGGRQAGFGIHLGVHVKPVGAAGCLPLQATSS